MCEIVNAPFQPYAINGKRGCVGSDEIAIAKEIDGDVIFSHWRVRRKTGLDRKKGAFFEGDVAHMGAVKTQVFCFGKKCAAIKVCFIGKRLLMRINGDVEIICIKTILILQGNI